MDKGKRVIDIKTVKLTYRLTPALAKKFKVKLAEKGETAQSVIEAFVEKFTS